jgi:uncharacterized membrane protein YgcG
MTRRTLAGVAAIAGLLAGCGGGGSSKPLTESDFCAQKAEAECQVADRCVNNKDACKTQRMTACTAFATQAKASGKRMFVAANVGNCIGKTNAVYAKTSPITPTELADMNDACEYVFQGKGKVNVDMCDLKYDCDGKVICDKMFCAMTTNVTAGCGNPGDTCPAGKYCAPNSAGNPVCTDRAMMGTACDAKPCLENLHCAANLCAERVAAQGSCSTNDDCAPAAPYCDPYAGNKCDPGLSFSPGSPSCADYGGGGTGTGGSGGGAGGSGGGAGGSGGGAGGGDGGSQPGTFSQVWDFTTDAEGWTNGFSDYPPNVGTGYDLMFGWAALPPELPPGGGLRISGNNHSDDLFMYIARAITGLRPNVAYLMNVILVIGTNASAECGGIGGAPGTSVAMKIGASATAPSTQLDNLGWLQLNLDKGNQSNGGTDLEVVGNISNTLPCVTGSPAPYQAKTLTLSNFRVTSSADGTVFAIMGTDSGFEGITTLFYDRVSLTLTPAN